jgi:uncharacterized protein YkwD
MQLAGAKLFKAMAFAFSVVTLAQVGASLAHAQRFEIPRSAKAAIIDATNAYRQSKGLAPLNENEGASREAQAYANYLAQTMRGVHSADGRDPLQGLRAGGVKFCKFRGENWHESWTRPARASPDAAMRFWKKSPGHERALRSPSNEIGVGVAGWRHGNQWYYQEIQVFIDTSCLKGTETAAAQIEDKTPSLPERKPVPSLPDRNPLRVSSP